VSFTALKLRVKPWGASNEVKGTDRKLYFSWAAGENHVRSGLSVFDYSRRTAVFARDDIDKYAR
jgi:hypothetical protein